MRLALLTALFIPLAVAQSNFSGNWKLNSSLSEMRVLPAPADLFLKVEQSATMLSVSGGSQEGGPFSTVSYPLDGSADKRKFDGSSFDTRTKWEGAALLANILVSGPQDYAVMERWTRSRDGNTLTIRRTIVRQGNERESTLVYQAPGAATVTEAAPATMERRALPSDSELIELAPVRSGSAILPDVERPTEYVVASGTRLLLRLTNSVNTRHTSTGDRIYLETVVPFFVDGHLIIPRGSIVIGTVAEAQKAGRVKGRSSLSLRFESLTLPNGVARDFRALPDQVDGHGRVDKSEGKIQGDGNKGGDARTVGTTTAAGAGVGGVIGAASGHVGAGLGIGAAAGAAAGLAGVLGSRGPEVVLPPGTTMELVLDRDLRYTRAELQRRVQ
jgi:type IV secretion system protein VirB10